MENTKIEWTDNTFNLWWGCTKISPACKNCYAETLSNRFKKAEWGPGKERTLIKDTSKPYKWARRCQKEGAREKVFTSSMSDVFDPEVLTKWKDDLFKIINETSHSLDWLILTKRAEEMYTSLSGKGSYERIKALSNNWVGVTAENQKEADNRIPWLIKTPAKVRFLSCEPLLSPINLKPYLDHIDWVIVGGESGPNARHMEVEWVREIMQQCQVTNTPFFFKQWGSQRKGSDIHGIHYKQFPVVE